MDIVLSVLSETWRLVAESAPYLLVGFLLAGLLHTLLPADRVSRWLGRQHWSSVVKAAAIGAPLPLCSCAVVPVAAELRNRGASKAATTSFLISTPESGVDSISLTYALMGAPMAIARLFAAMLTALVAGLTQLVADAGNRRVAAVPLAAGQTCCHGSDAAASAPEHACGGGHATSAPAVSTCCGGAAKPSPVRTWLGRLGAGVRYGFVDMFVTLGGYLAIGFLLAGALSVVLDRFDVLHRALDSPFAMPMMLIAGIPLYVCAVSATPMVAVLMGAGLSPGAGLVFLLTGPATNAATFVLLRKLLGTRGVVIYFVSIAGCALAAGWLLDAVWGRSITATVETLTCNDCAPASASAIIAGTALLLLIGNGIVRQFLSRNGRDTTSGQDVTAGGATATLEGDVGCGRRVWR